ncbi:MAG: translation initiation factor IF-2 [Candidatus Syntrophosphaera sp.]
MPEKKEDKIRVHELAKELKISTMALKKHLTDLGVHIKSHMSLIDISVADQIRQKYNEQFDAERKAEKDRIRLAEMREAAKAEKEEKALKKKKTSKTKPEPEAEISAKEEVEEPSEDVGTKKKPPKKEGPRAPIIVPYTQATPVKPRTKKVARPKTKEEPARKPEDRTRKVKVEEVIPEPPPTIKPTKKTSDKKFGKTKVSHDDLGEKSKHKKAKVDSAKRGKKKVATVVEPDEAEISRNIKKVLQKTSKKKKYHREAQSVTPQEDAPVIIREFTSVSELSKLIDITAAEIISKFFAMGQMVTMNQRLDRDSLEMICEEFDINYKFEDEFGAEIIDRGKEQYEDVEEESRPPVVTIMGHVDHGKTSILDYIRQTNIVAGESGGITQHIGAYQIEINDKKVTFLDTPGHEAFTAMRARGANVTDIAVIVVAANEGLKPQTREAIDHAKAAGVNLIVAINKIDLPDANPDRVIAQFLEYGVNLEQYGGEVPWCKTSATTGEGIQNLIEIIMLTAEIMDLKAKSEVPASGVVIESSKDPRMGTIATILVQEGILSKGEIVVCGATHGRIRKIENERGQEMQEMLPSDVGRIYGLDDAPKAGDILNQVDSEKTARSISSERNQIRLEREKYQNKASLQNIFARIKEDEINDLNVIIKTDTDGSAEALADSFAKITNEEVQVNIIRKSVGGINEADVSLASASNAVIIGFHVRANPQARKLAEDEDVEIKTYQVIYDAIEDVKLSLQGMLEPDYEEKVIGSATVKQVFKIKKIGTIAGCQVDSGVIRRNSKVRLYRDDVLIAEDDLASLKHYADDVKEVRAGTDCGLSLAEYSDIKEGDVVECYIIEEVAKKL